MGILFAISVLALAALLWASLSIARHIRQERQRHASAGFAGPAVAGPGASTSDPVFPAHEFSFAELSPYGPTVVSRTLIEHAPPPPIPGPTAEHLIEDAPEKITGVEPELNVEASVPSMAQEGPAAGPPLESLPSLEAFEEREADTEAEAQAAIQAQAEGELPPDLEAQTDVDPLAPTVAPPDEIALTSHSEPRLPPTASAEESPMPRAVPTFLPLTPRPPSAPVAPPLKNRLDWTYFNKDMGDLSDPLPSHSRQRQRPH